MAGSLVVNEEILQQEVVTLVLRSATRDWDPEFCHGHWMGHWRLAGSLAVSRVPGS